MFLQTFNKHCDSDLYTPKYCLLNHMVEDIRNFEALYFDRSPCEQFNVHIKQPFTRTSQWKRMRRMKTVNVMERNYERALLYWKEKIDGSLRKKDERSAKAETNGSYLVYDGITIAIDELAQAADRSS